MRRFPDAIAHYHPAINAASRMDYVREEKISKVVTLAKGKHPGALAPFLHTTQTRLTEAIFISRAWVRPDARSTVPVKVRFLGDQKVFAYGDLAAFRPPEEGQDEPAPEWLDKVMPFHAVAFEDGEALVDQALGLLFPNKTEIAAEVIGDLERDTKIEIGFEAAVYAVTSDRPPLPTRSSRPIGMQGILRHDPDAGWVLGGKEPCGGARIETLLHGFAGRRVRVTVEEAPEE